MQGTQVFALSVITFMLLTPAVALAQFSGSQAFDYIWVKTFKFERGWLAQPNLLVINVIIPTIAIYAIFLGLLRSIRLLEGMGSSMEHVIAALVAFAALFFGGIGYVAGLLAFMGHFSVVIFFILFIVGAILYSKGFINKRRAIDVIYSGFRKDSSKIKKEIEDYADKAQKEILAGQRAESAGNQNLANRHFTKAAYFETLRAKKEEEMRNIHRALKDAEAA